MSNMNKELVSVIMPTYNAGKYLSDSIGSILAQTYENLELLITDDGSTEERTLQLLKEFSEKDPRVKVVYLKENLGSGHSRNNAIERAEGRYIAFCDCDDRWMPEKAYMQEKDCALVSSSYLICNEDSEITGINISPDKVTFGMEKRDNKIGCLTAVYDTHRLGRKFLMPSIRKRQDWGLFLNILKECGVCYAITGFHLQPQVPAGEIQCTHLPRHSRLQLAAIAFLLFVLLPAYLWNKSTQAQG